MDQEESYFAFDGEFRRRPQQRLGGLTKIGKKEQIVNKAQEERKKRERDRLEQISSSIIQKSVRSFLVRARWKRSIRSQFDSNIKVDYTETELGTQTTRLNLCFDPSVDIGRLTHVGKHWVLLRESLSTKRDGIWSLRGRILLRNAIRVINKTHNSTEQSTLLRLLDTLTAPSSAPLPNPIDRSHFGLLWLDLVYYGHFYEELRILIKSKLVAKNPQPNSTSPLLTILSRPFYLVRALESSYEEGWIITQRFLKSSSRLHLSLSSNKDFGNLILSQYIEDFSRDVIPPSGSGAPGKFHRLISSSLLSEIFPWRVLATRSVSDGVLLPPSSNSNKNFGNSLERNILFLLLSLMNPRILNGDESELEGAVLVVSQRIQCIEDKRLWRKVIDLECAGADEESLMELDEDELEYEVNREERRVMSALKHETEQLFGLMKSLAHELDLGHWLTSGDSWRNWAILCPILGTMIKIQGFLGGKDELSHIVMKYSGKCKTLMNLFNQITHSTYDNIFIFCWFVVNIINSFHDYELLNKCVSSSDMEILVRHIKEVYVQSYTHEIDFDYVRGPENKAIYSALLAFHERNTRIEVLDDDIFRSSMLQSQLSFSNHNLTFDHFQMSLWEAWNDIGNPQEFKLLRILREFPFVLRFQERLSAWRRLIDLDRDRRQNFEHRQHVHVRRGRIYEDAFSRLSVYDVPDIRANIAISLENRAGLGEAGIDGGGLLREFLTEVTKDGVNPNNGLFRLDSQNRFYPSPVAKNLMRDYREHFFFIGRLVGKALYEGTHLELPFSPFFVQSCLTQVVSSSVDYLALLDSDLHKHLLELKTFRGDWSSLGLDFTITSTEVGVTKQIELKPGGADLFVNQENVIEYIHLMANYKINKELQEECKCFRRGLMNVIPTTVMFSWKELQLLISGSDKPIDIQDWQTNTNYTGGFTADTPTIKNFWKIISEYDEVSLRKLLKFVTSCSRPPLAGFKYLNPNFGIQNSVTPDRLPSASTCINLLKLPPIDSLGDLREKLTYAINSEAGFELS